MKTLFTEEETAHLVCYHCGKDLIKSPGSHLLMKDELKGECLVITDIRWLCNHCDRHDLYRDLGWKDISDLLIGDVLIQWMVGIITGLHMKRQSFTDEAMERLQIFLFTIFPYVCKKMTSEQRKVFKDLHLIPRVFGGLG